MKSLFIPIHSFVDVITNSSSEIFVSADEGTVEAVKESINNLLKGTGSNKTADELFDFSVCIDVDNPTPYKERKPGEGYTITVPIDSEVGKEAYEERERRVGNGDSGADIGILVKAKEGANEHLISAASALSNLTGLFQIDASYNS